jgi:uncharacterized membrane protein
MNMRKLLVFALILVAFAGVASAVNLEITSLEINNKNIDPTVDSTHSNNYLYERGENLDVDVCVKALADVKDAQVEANIYGYRYSNKDTGKVSDSSDTFDLDSGDRDCQTLHLQIPDRIDVDYYKLRVRVADRDGVSFENDYELHLKGISRSSAVQIKDFTLTPEDVVAGRAFTAMVKVRNYGSTDLKDLKVTVSVPDLNIKASEFMDSLDADESKTFEELLLRVPDCAKAGDYNVEMTVEFDEYEETTQSTTIHVLKSDTCGAAASGTDGKSVITVPSSQEISQGQSVVYPIMLTNNGATAKTYTVSVSGASNWATTKIDPSAVMIVPAGQSRTAYLYVTANQNAELGDKGLTLTIDDGTESKQVPLTARITKAAGSDWSDVKKGLEIGLIILVIVLIIIGLIIGFNKLKDNKQESEPYY